jgi:predicted amidohydrolase
MILASAQTKPHRFDIDKNLSDHYQLIDIAAQHKVNFIAFPELSITGYERDKARELAFEKEDKRLGGLRDLSAKHNMIIVAGAPVIAGEEMHIGSFVLFPDGEISIYTKQFLHTGEENFYSPSSAYNPMIKMDGERISLAICADIDHPQHAENASKVNTTIYVPSIFFSPGGLPEGYDNLSGYAKKYSMHVLMSNFCVESWGRPSGGKSALWNNKGELIDNLNDSSPGLLIVEKNGETIKSHRIYL